MPGSIGRGLAAAALAAAAGVAAPAPAQAPPAAVAAELDPHRLVLARQIIAIAFPAEGRRGMLMRSADTMMAQARTAAASGARVPLDAGAERILERFFERARAQSERAIDANADALFDSIARGYARQFSAAELREIRAFVGTPTGAKYLQRSPELLSDPDVARANSAYMATVFAALQPLQADLRRELDEYFKQKNTGK